MQANSSVIVHAPIDFVVALERHTFTLYRYVYILQTQHENETCVVTVQSNFVTNLNFATLQFYCKQPTRTTCSSSCIEAASGRPSATRAIIVIITILLVSWAFSWKHPWNIYVCANHITLVPTVEVDVALICAQPEPVRTVVTSGSQ